METKIKSNNTRNELHVPNKTEGYPDGSMKLPNMEIILLNTENIEILFLIEKGPENSNTIKGLATKEVALQIASIDKSIIATCSLKNISDVNTENSMWYCLANIQTSIWKKKFKRIECDTNRISSLLQQEIFTHHDLEFVSKLKRDDDLEYSNGIKTSLIEKLHKHMGFVK